MGKNRKNRSKKGTENDVEVSNEEAPVCPHIAKAVNFGAMRKFLLKPASTIGKCTSCTMGAGKRASAKGSNGITEPEGTDLELEFETTIWVCLQCGHQGCDRNSKEKHALKHFETPHSCIHSIVVNLSSWTTWCYSCDEEILAENSRKVKECVDFLQKQCGRPFTSHVIPPSSTEILNEKNETTQENDVPAIIYTPKVTNAAPPVTCPKVKGLSNLGNTCFFNSVMQSLCQTQGLEGLLDEACEKDHTMSISGWMKQHHDSDSDSDSEEEDSKGEELPAIDIVPSGPGDLTLSLLKFLQGMSNTNAKTTVSPNSLFGNICKKAARFKGYQQQDSQELLRYLLDVIRNEEIKRAQVGILKLFNIPEKVNTKEVNEETKNKVKEYGQQAKFTILDSLFGGQLISTVTCEECKHVSQIFEPFLDLSLPVTEDKAQCTKQMLGGQRKGSMLAAGDNDQEKISPKKGVDGFAAANKLSKYQERKNRKNLKKEAKRKGKRNVQFGNVRKTKAVEEENDGEEEEEGQEAQTLPTEGDTGVGETASSDSQPVKENSSSQDSVKSEVHKIVSANSDSNLAMEVGVCEDYVSVSSNLNDYTSSRPPLNDLPIMSSTTKKMHILPAEYLQSTASDAKDQEKPGIKEEKDCEIEKLTCSFSNIDLQEMNDGCRTNGEGLNVNQVSAGLVSERVIVDLTVVENESDSGTASRCGLEEEKQETEHCCKTEGETAGESAPVDNDFSDFATGEESTVAGGEKVGDVATGEESTVTDGEKIGDVATVEESTVTDGEKVGDVATGEESTVADGEKVGDVATGEESTVADGEKIGDVATGEESTVTDGENVGDIATGEESTVADGDKVAVCESLHDNGKGEGIEKGFKSARELHQEARHRARATLAPQCQSASKQCSLLSCLRQFTVTEMLTGANKVKCKSCTKLRLAKCSSDKDKKGTEAVYSNISKQFLIMTPPATLTLHLKRFEQVSFLTRKVNSHVEFPMVLDLAPFCSAMCHQVKDGQQQVLYSLYGVVEHSGTMRAGHYTAYVKVRPGMSSVNRFLLDHLPHPHQFIDKYINQAYNLEDTKPRKKVKDVEAPPLETLVPQGCWFHASDSVVTSVSEAAVLKAQAYLLFYERIF